MNPDLFPTVQGDSPRLRWMKSHDLHTERNARIADAPWACWSGQLKDALLSDAIGTGMTEEDAIHEWAVVTGNRLWNEEAHP